MFSLSEPKNPVELSDTREQLLRELDESIKVTKRLDWITSVVGIVLSIVLSLLTSALSISDSFPSLIKSIRIRVTYVWFFAGVLGFQFLLIFVLWLIRKKNREVIKLKEHLIGVYLSAINRSRLNPHPEIQ
jgi:uncharacterized protein YacL